MNNNENNDFMNIKPIDNTPDSNMDPNQDKNTIVEPVVPIDSTVGSTNIEVPSINENIVMDNQIPQEVPPMGVLPSMNEVNNEFDHNMQTPPSMSIDMNQATSNDRMQTIPPMMPGAQEPNHQNQMPENMTIPPMQQTMEQGNMQQPLNVVPPVYNQDIGIIPPSNTTSVNKKPSFFSKNGKYILIVLFLILLALVGFFLFGSKKLKCTMENEYSGVKTSQSIQVRFSGDKASQVKMIMSMDLKNIDDEIKGMKESLIEGLKEDVKDFEKEGLKVEIKETSNTITVIVSGTEKLSNLLEMSESKLTFDQIKKQFEAGGYTCK